MPDIPAPRWITYVRLCDLLPAVRNPKRHHLPGLVACLERFGWTQPVLADERTQRLVAGHGRMAAAVQMKAQGSTPIPGGVLVDDDGEWLVPVTRGWSSSTDAEADAYLAADNRLTESGGWDDAELVDLLEGIHVADASLFDVLTWDADELDDLFKAYRGDTEQPAAAAPGGGEDGADEDGGSAPERVPRDIECPACGHRFNPSQDP